MNCRECGQPVPDGKRRSDGQNRLYWGSIVPAVQGYFNSTRDVPLSAEQVHYVLKCSFIGADEVEGPLGTILVPKKSRKLSTKQFTEYCDAIFAHFSTLGVHFPAPEDVLDQ